MTGIESPDEEVFTVAIINKWYRGSAPLSASAYGVNASGISTAIRCMAPQTATGQGTGVSAVETTSSRTNLFTLTTADNAVLIHRDAKPEGKALRVQMGRGSGIPPRGRPV
ncbi:MAG TPA: hypothetical protein VE172_09850 [Stackebrandtia sp.]|uniref:hypothetical protein n=1 Tax=Stackebrandtia sp. TaxID=2023065 RepID=UPI002D2B5A1F|nr:hypothetical protein [Stackebrandtia sp.]HZE39099.1 hypothetical protein [Stackebrandtia sp.]